MVFCVKTRLNVSNVKLDTESDLFLLLVASIVALKTRLNVSKNRVLLSNSGLVPAKVQRLFLVRL